MERIDIKKIIRAALKKQKDVGGIGDEGRSAAWFSVYDLCLKLGMKQDDDDRSGEEDVLYFILDRKSK